MTRDGASYTGTTGTTISGTTATYNPISGLRFNWSETANLSRSVDINYGSNPVGAWTWNGNSNNPWQLSGGTLTTGNSTSLPVFQETITASYGGGDSGGINYHGCGSSIGSSCNFGFKETSRDCGDGRACGTWWYYYPGNASLILSMSVKADNAFGISFAGNASGLVSVNSNAPVILAGQINTRPAPPILRRPARSPRPWPARMRRGAGLLTNSLNLTATGGSGSSSAAFGATLTDGGFVSAHSGSQAYLTLASQGTVLNSTHRAGMLRTGYARFSITATNSLHPEAPVHLLR